MARFNDGIEKTHSAAKFDGIRKRSCSGRFYPQKRDKSLIFIDLPGDRNRDIVQLVLMKTTKRKIEKAKIGQK